MFARICLMAMLFCLFTSSLLWADTEDSNNTDGLRIVVNSVDVNDEILKLNYEIQNNSQQEIWICDSLAAYRGICDFDVYLDKDDKTLIIRKRFDLPTDMIWTNPPFGRYIRIGPGKKRTESLLLSVPVYGRSRFDLIEPLQNLVYATQIAIEIGYYEGNLPEIFINLFEESEKSRNLNNGTDSNLTKPSGRVLDFNYICEKLRQRDEEVVIIYSRRRTISEKVLSCVVDNLKIPYGGEKFYSDEEIEEVEEVRDAILSPKPVPVLDLATCTKLEIHYQPSMFEFFFPFEGQQSLISDEEKKYLQSENTIVIENEKYINAFAQEINKRESEPTCYSDDIRQKSEAQVTCYQKNEHLMTLKIIYNDFSILTKEKLRIKYKDGLESLRELTPKVQQIELRVKCAAHMKNLWYRLRLYNKYMKDSFQNSDLIYTPPNAWCDLIMKPHTINKYYFHKFDRLPHVAPNTNELKSFYAMNPNCRPNSPSDMVLLFETKAGWNQHGGSELFTFDNHEPKGGCVLLNNGTVKFIRTEEELKALRWKR